jgi:hypothetical protein
VGKRGKVTKNNKCTKGKEKWGKRGKGKRITSLKKGK